MASEGLLPFNSNPFLRITDFKVPVRGLVLSMAEFDEDEDLAYLYKADGTFIETKPGVPRDGGAVGWGQHTMFAKVGPDIFSIDGGSSNFDIYKNGVGFVGSANSGTVWISSHGGTLWIIKGGSVILAFDAKTGASQGAESVFWEVLRHRTNGTHHVYSLFRGDTFAPDWRMRHVLSNSSFGDEVVLIEMQRTTNPSNPVDLIDVAINSDRVAGVSWNSSTNISEIKIFDLSGALKDTLTNAGKAEMLLMSEDKLYASAAWTPDVTMWDITEDETGEKVYTPAGTFSTPAPYVWYGNLAT